MPGCCRCTTRSTAARRIDVAPGTQVSVTGNGTHTLTTWAEDAAGNSSAPRDDTINIDNQNPNDTTTAPGAPIANNGTVAVNGNDTISGVDHVEWKIDQGDVQSGRGRLARDLRRRRRASAADARRRPRGQRHGLEDHGGDRRHVERHDAADRHLDHRRHRLAPQRRQRDRLGLRRRQRRPDRAVAPRRLLDPDGRDQLGLQRSPATARTRWRPGSPTTTATRPRGVPRRSRSTRPSRSTPPRSRPAGCLRRRWR